MDYATAVQVFFGTAGAIAEPGPVRNATPARRLRDAVEPLGTHGFWSPLVNERLAARGLNFLTGYVWGRAAPMGEPVGPVVASAFAAFEPGLMQPVLRRPPGTRRRTLGATRAARGGERAAARVSGSAGSVGSEAGSVGSEVVSRQDRALAPMLHVHGSGAGAPCAWIA